MEKPYMKQGKDSWVLSVTWAGLIFHLSPLEVWLIIHSTPYNNMQILRLAYTWGHTWVQECTSQDMTLLPLHFQTDRESDRWTQSSLLNILHIHLVINSWFIKDLSVSPQLFCYLYTATTGIQATQAFDKIRLDTLLI